MAPAESGGDAQADAMASMMLPMLLLLGMMVMLMFYPGLRVGLSDTAGSVLEPMLPFHQTYFVPTVFIVGSSIMVVNTIIRSFFMDPLQQAHFSHRSRQIGKQLREARMARDTAMADKMQTTRDDARANEDAILDDEANGLHNGLHYCDIQLDGGFRGIIQSRIRQLTMGPHVEFQCQSTLDIPGLDSDLHSNECSLGKNSGQTHQDRPFLPASSSTVRGDHPRASTAHAR